MLKLNQQYLVLATGTDIGKTFFVSEICKKLRQKNISVEAIKPIASGFTDDDLESDTAKILRALGKDFNQKNIEETTPFRLKAPFSPLKAANLEGVKINFNEVKNFCQKKIQHAEIQSQILLIEGAGGVMTPINKDKTFLDLATELNIPVLLIGGVYLGAISHVLCAVEALKCRDIKVQAIIINDYNNKNHHLNSNDIIAEIENLSNVTAISLDKFCD